MTVINLNYSQQDEWDRTRAALCQVRSVVLFVKQEVAAASGINQEPTRPAQWLQQDTVGDSQGLPVVEIGSAELGCEQIRDKTFLLGTPRAVRRNGSKWT